MTAREARGVRHGSALVALTNSGGLVLAFVASIVLARSLGANGYGQYAFVIAITGLLSVISTLGLQRYLVREVARGAAAGIFARRWADIRVLGAGAPLSAALLAAGALQSEHDLSLALTFASPIPLIASIGNVRRALMQAIGHPVAAQWPIALLAPSVIVLGSVLLISATGALTVTQALGLSVLGVSMATLVAAFQLSARRADLGRTEARSSLPLSLKDSLPFMLLGGLFLLVGRVDILMLGLLSSPAETGAYAIASRVAESVTILVIAANTVLAPKIARLYREDRLGDLKSLVRRSQRFVLLLSAPSSVALFVMAGAAIAFVYGPGYADLAATPLRILLVAQTFVVIAGPLGTILEMTGHAKTSVKAVSLGLIANIGLNLALIPEWGANGAAAATALSILLVRLLLLRQVKIVLATRPSSRETPDAQTDSQ